jgi:hypothetical protein
MSTHSFHHLCLNVLVCVYTELILITPLELAHTIPRYLTLLDAPAPSVQMLSLHSFYVAGVYNKSGSDSFIREVYFSLLCVDEKSAVAVLRNFSGTTTDLERTFDQLAVDPEPSTNWLLIRNLRPTGC